MVKVANNNNQQQPVPALPNPAQVLAAPMSVLDAQAKAFSEALTNMLNMGQANVSTVLSTLQAPLAQPTEPLQKMLVAPLEIPKQVMAQLQAGQIPVPPIPGVTPTTPTPTTPTTPSVIPYEMGAMEPTQMYNGAQPYMMMPGTTPQAVPEAVRGNVIEGIGGLFNIVRPD